MTDMFHWHGHPSELRNPDECCTAQFQRVLEQQVRGAVREAETRELDERRRFILEAARQMAAYRDATGTVLSADQHVLVARVTDHCIDLVRKAACICPDIDVSALNEGPASRFVKGRDGRCGVHGEVSGDS